MQRFVTIAPDMKTILQWGRAAPEHIDAQPVPAGGRIVMLAEDAPDVTGDTHEYDATTAAFVVKTPDQAKIDAQALRASILEGFKSSALGAEYHYPSTELDQRNMLTVATVGGLLQCADAAGTWALHAHTASQGMAVLADFTTMRDTARQALAALD